MIVNDSNTNSSCLRSFYPCPDTRFATQIQACPPVAADRKSYESNFMTILDTESQVGSIDFENRKKHIDPNPVSCQGCRGSKKNSERKEFH